MKDSERSENPVMDRVDALSPFRSFKVYDNHWPEIRTRALIDGTLTGTPVTEEAHEGLILPIQPKMDVPAAAPMHATRPPVTDSKRPPIAAVEQEWEIDI